MTCPRCGFANQEHAAACESCGLAFRGRASGGGGYAPAAGGSASGESKKGLAIASLVLGILSVPLVCAFGVGLLTGLVGLILGVVALVKANRNPQEYGGKGLAIGGIVAAAVCFMSVPIVAAIAIPSLLRARVAANEAMAIGDVRTVISAQAAYGSANGGFYDTLECLGAPGSCIPGYTGGPMLDPTLASGATKGGYARTFHPGPPLDASQRSERLSPSSLTSYAYVAVPASANRTGVRGFCGDASGIICVTMDGSAPAVVDGACSQASCQPLR